MIFAYLEFGMEPIARKIDKVYLFLYYMDKVGQQGIGMGFGMIFSIFLIIVFFIVAFIAINSFLDIGDSASVGMFYDELQNAVDNSIRSQSSEKVFDIRLPSGIEKVCFANLSSAITNKGREYDLIEMYEVYDANVFLVPPRYAENMAWKYIDYVNISATIEGANPYCVDVDNGLLIKKSFYDKYVVIE
jgi:hypothetical protein